MISLSAPQPPQDRFRMYQIQNTWTFQCSSFLRSIPRILTTKTRTNPKRNFGRSRQGLVEQSQQNQIGQQTWAFLYGFKQAAACSNQPFAVESLQTIWQTHMYISHICIYIWICYTYFVVTEFIHVYIHTHIHTLVCTCIYVDANSRHLWVYVFVSI